ncbi:hypothetical protein CONLIGDRAFT_638084 [Coniochaeta ligniaria NRRL 30616]|uniref:Uncharacterized protein n=1 Tax=Coniochaeta ligniaria NRRL 30616 TaxID=1408157 RepID=A0A1J7J5S2_9PEZI|nr:hypothetical protein CONLIGDRAFT_638084 [Coniochaeta ligniaria NRRL 30616]
MRSNTGIVAAALGLASIFASVSAQDLYPEPITIGQLAYPHGHQILAWTPTKTSMIDACTNQSSRTVLQVYETIPPTVPLCGTPFALDGYSDLELLCADGTSVEASQVTAIATNGTQTHNCTSLPLTVYGTHCHGEYSPDSIWQLFACQ